MSDNSGIATPPWDSLNTPMAPPKFTLAYFSNEFPPDDLHLIVRKLFERSKSRQHPTLARFIEEATSTVRDEIRKLPNETKGLIPTFRTIFDFAEQTELRMDDLRDKWAETNTRNQTAYSLAMDTDKSFFEHINSTPNLAKEFGGYMRSRSVITPQSGVDGLVQNFDWASLGNGLVVDVGGGDGEIAIGLAEEFPDLSFVVQDLPRFIDPGKEIAKKLPSSTASRVELQAHDFFNTQPVKGADVYLFRGVFHNWGREDGAKLLKKTIAAMKADSIIIVDMVLLALGSLPAYVKGMQREKDLTMMQLLNAGERQWEDWQSLLEDAGLKVHSINRPSGKRESVMVAVFANSVSGSG